MSSNVKVFVSRNQADLLRQWDNEMAILRIECSLHKESFTSLGSFILSCPKCETLGFYGPRDNVKSGEITRKYFACKYCGAWQDIYGGVWGKHGIGWKEYIHVECQDHKNDKIGRYDWRAPWEKDCLGKCQSGDGFDVRKYKRPLDNKGHYYIEVKSQFAEEVEKLQCILDDIRNKYM